MTCNATLEPKEFPGKTLRCELPDERHIRHKAVYGRKEFYWREDDADVAGCYAGNPEALGFDADFHPAKVLLFKRPSAWRRILDWFRGTST